MVIPLIPIDGYILLEPFEQTAGNLILSDNAKTKPQTGRVLKISNSTKNEHGIEISCPVKVGDLICYKNWGTEIFNYKGKDYVFAKFTDVVGFIHEEATTV